MNPWPDVSDYGCEDCCPPEAWCNSCRMNFEAHTKDAAMERLRVAVEALEDVTANPAEREKYYPFRKYMRGIDGCTCPGDHFCKCGRSSVEMNIDGLIDGAEGAFKALAAIGPLP